MFPEYEFIVNAKAVEFVFRGFFVIKSGKHFAILITKSGERFEISVR